VPTADIGSAERADQPPALEAGPLLMAHDQPADV